MQYVLGELWSLCFIKNPMDDLSVGNAIDCMRRTLNRIFGEFNRKSITGHDVSREKRDDSLAATGYP